MIPEKFCELLLRSVDEINESSIEKFYHLIRMNPNADRLQLFYDAHPTIQVAHAEIYQRRSAH